MPARSSTDLRHRIILCFLAALVLAATLTAGLWPFRFHPPNDVAWIPGQPGLYFGDYGTVISDGEVVVPRATSPSGASIELWLVPAATEDSSSIIAIYARGNPHQFRIRQSLDDLFIMRDIPEGREKWRTSYVSVDSVFRKDRKMHVLASSGADGTRVYLNGPLVRVAPSLHLEPSDFTGRLVVANSPVATETWSGTIRGIALYGRQISPEEAAAHFRDGATPAWIGDSEVQGALAFYPFTEGSGRVVHNIAPGGQPNLILPDHYLILHQPFLTPPWKEFRPNLPYLEDVAVNIAGLMPLGFMVCAICLYIWPVARPVLWATLFGMLVSVNIEVIQAFLPNRSSGMTDLITNTAGAFLGAALLLAPPVQRLAAQLGFARRGGTPSGANSTNS